MILPSPATNGLNCQHYLDLSWAWLNVNLIKLLPPASFVNYFVVPLSKKIIEVFAKWSTRRGKGGQECQPGTYFPGSASYGEDHRGLNWIITYNMIDSKLNTFYDHSDGKICIVVYLFDQK